jgi:hypothetical protein
MWGVDNDGNAQDGYRFEEVLQIKAGDDYGYPLEGTYGPKHVRNDGPLWISQTAGTAATVWGPDVGRPPGLIIGGCGVLTALTAVPDLVLGSWEHDLDNGSQVTIAEEIPGCMTGAEPVGGHSLLAGVFGSPEGGKLLRFDFSSAPPATPTPFAAASFTPWAPPA